MKKNTATSIGCSFLVMLSCVLSFGCAAKDEGISDTLALEESDADYAVAANDPRARKALMRKAHSALGTPYVLGGTSPGGFDCSGLVQWTFNHVGVALPRTAREQSQVGRPVRSKDLQEGDIVAFRHPRRGYHTGIYVGEGKFIHSPRKRTRVQVASMDDPYFSQTFVGARRVVAGKAGAVAEGAQSQIAENTVRADSEDMDDVSRTTGLRSERKRQDAGAASSRKKASSKDKDAKGTRPKKSEGESGSPNKEKKRAPDVEKRKPQKQPSPESANVRVRPTAQRGT